MSVPRDRVSHGAHAFPFTGLRTGEGGFTSLPCLPVRVRQGDRGWSTPFDAVIDTGSTRTVVPGEWADHLGLERTGEAEPMRGAGGPFETRAATVDLSVVDAHFPQVTCWEIVGAMIRVGEGPRALDYPVLGWDVLRLFRVTFEPRQRWIEMKLLAP